MTCLSAGRVAAYSLLIWSFFISTLCLSIPALAQTADIDPPVIALDGIDTGARGELQEFTFVVTDDLAVESVIFHYRLSPDAGYVDADMARIGDTNLYTFSLQSADIAATTEAIEYYVEAKDEAGNRTLQGFSFDPLRRMLTDNFVGTVAGNTQPEVSGTSPLSSLSTTRKIMYGVLGLVVVGALISASDNGGDEASDPMVPVTIFADPSGLSQ